MTLPAVQAPPREEAWRHASRALADAPAPWCLGWLFMGLVFQFALALLGLVIGSLALVGQVISNAEAVSSGLVLLWAGILLWLLLYAAASFSVVTGLESRVPWGWAAAFGWLFCRTAGSCLVMVALLGRAVQHGAGSFRLLETCLLLAWTAGHGVLAASLFRGRRWFGVPEREAWGTLRRRGAWALWAGAAAEVAPALVLGMILLWR